MIPITRGTGFLLALGAAERGDVAPLAAWLRTPGGVNLDEMEATALAAFVEAARPKRPAHRPRKLTPQDEGAIIAMFRMVDQLPPEMRKKRGLYKGLILAFAEEYGVGTRTMESVIRKARAASHQRKK